jgi:hypothetical protein
VPEPQVSSESLSAFASADLGQSGLLPDGLDETALAALDAAAHTAAFDMDLLRTPAARDIRLQIEAIVTLLRKMDDRAVLARQGLLSRLTGADVEARLEFELAGQNVLTAMGRLRRAAQNGRHVLGLLAAARADLVAEQARLEALIAAAKALLTTASAKDEFIATRFERRLANIMAMHAANILTIEQIGLAHGVLSGLLDRITDVDTLLLPLWQRNVLALAHASVGSPHRDAARDFAHSHRQLISHLDEGSGK